MLAEAYTEAIDAAPSPDLAAWTGTGVKEDRLIFFMSYCQRLESKDSLLLCVLYVCICAAVYTYMHIFMYTYVQTYILICYIYMYTYIHIFYTYIRVCIPAVAS